MQGFPFILTKHLYYFSFSNYFFACLPQWNTSAKLESGKIYPLKLPNFPNYYEIIIWLDLCWIYQIMYFTNRAAIIFVYCSHFINASITEWPVVAFCDTKQMSWLTTKYTIFTHKFFCKLYIVDIIKRWVLNFNSK